MILWLNRVLNHNIITKYRWMPYQVRHDKLGHITGRDSTPSIELHPVGGLKSVQIYCPVDL